LLSSGRRNGAGIARAAPGALPVAVLTPLTIEVQLMVGQAAFVEFRALLVQPSLGPGPLRLVLGDPRLALRCFRVLGSLLRLLAVAGHGFLTAPLELALLGPRTGRSPGARDQERKRDHEQHHDDDGDYYASRHETSLGCCLPSPTDQRYP
jgi:hypothetical protein